MRDIQVHQMSRMEFSEKLLAWFDQHGRHDLPWQIRPDPYRVWLSEIMLQQTQVDTVIPYFHRFVEKFPSVEILADAEIDDVLALWSGLGYYARARNLHKTARIVRRELDGEFPDSVAQLTKLPGIGPSTAGALCALAFGARAPILDGNVKRVLARYVALDGWPGSTENMKTLWVVAERLTPCDHVASYTQAIMDLGATVCTRGKPDCDKCPVSQTCMANQADRAHEIPAARPKRQRPTRTTTMIMVTDRQARVLLKKRPPSGVWGGLWSFPEVDELNDVAGWCKAELGVTDPCIDCWKILRHRFTHFDLDISPVRVVAKSDSAPNGLKNAVSDSGMAGSEWVWYNTRSPQSLGLAAPVSQLLGELATQLENQDDTNGAMRTAG